MPDPVPSTEPKIPVGLASKIGYVLGIVQNLAAALILTLEGLPDDASEVIVIATLFASGTAVITRVNDGRQKQAAALYRDAPSPAQMDDFSGEPDEFDEDGLTPGTKLYPALPDMPSDEDLVKQYGAAPSPFKEPGVDGPMPEGAVGGKPGLNPERGS